MYLARFRVLNTAWIFLLRPPIAKVRVLFPKRYYTRVACTGSVFRSVNPDPKPLTQTLMLLWGRVGVPSALQCQPEAQHQTLLPAVILGGSGSPHLNETEQNLSENGHASNLVTCRPVKDSCLCFVYGPRPLVADKPCHAIAPLCKCAPPACAQGEWTSGAGSLEFRVSLRVLE